METGRTTRGADAFARGVALLVLAMMAARLAGAAAAPLAFDEAYYWRWSKHLAAGYYDHPPLVALVIRIGTALAGDTQLGVRLFSTLLGIPATWAVWRAAALLFGDRTLAATAALYFNLTLIVAVGTVIVTPDAPLLTASAFVLFFLAKVHQTGRGAWWLAVGLAVGSALAAKYTALIFGASILAWLLLVPEQRRWLATPWPYLGGVVAFAVFAPVILWNAEHGWASFIKQFGRAVPHGFTLRFLFEYVGGQVGLATPFVFVLGAMGLAAFARGCGGAPGARVLLAALIWPFAVYFAWHSLHARVEGNWTAPLFPAFAVAAAAAAHAVDWRGRWAQAAFWSRRLAAPVGLAITAIIYVQATVGVVPLGSVDPTARQLGAGWRNLGAEIDALRARVGAPAVLATGYATTAWLSFYLPSRPPVVQVNERIRWVNEPEPEQALFGAPLLYVCTAPCENLALVRARFARVEEAAQLERTRSGVVIERYVVFRVEGPRDDPLERAASGEPARR